MNRNRISAIFIILLLLVTPFSFAATINFKYDSSGNLVEDGNYKYSYDGFNQLEAIKDLKGNTLEEYSYDSEGNRIMKVEFGPPIQTTYYLHENLVRVVNSSGTYDFQYVYDDSGTLVGQVDSAGNFLYYHPDHLGSTSLVTDDKGKVVSNTFYLPFGEVLDGGNDRFLFTGQEKDGTGLMYYGARYYSPSLRQFTQPDSIIPDVYNPQDLNRYSYVRNNPYKYVDPSGHIAFLVPIAYGIATFVTTVAAVTSPYWMPQVNAYFAGQNIDDIDNAIKDPSPENIAWAAAGTYDLATPGFSEAGAAKKGLSVTKKALSKVDEVGPTLTASPKNLLRTQSLAEDSAYNIKKIKKSMKEKGFDPDYPIDVMDIDGNYYIINGHHRARAAGSLKIDKVPIRIVEGDMISGRTKAEVLADAKIAQEELTIWKNIRGKK